MRFKGRIHVDYGFGRVVGARVSTARVSLTLSEADQYSFTSEVDWPECDCTQAVERGVRDGMHDSGWNPDDGVNIVLNHIVWQPVDSTEQAFYLAGKCAARSFADLR